MKIWFSAKILFRLTKFFLQFFWSFKIRQGILYRLQLKIPLVYNATHQFYVKNLHSEFTVQTETSQLKGEILGSEIDGIFFIYFG